MLIEHMLFAGALVGGVVLAVIGFRTVQRVHPYTRYVVGQALPSSGLFVVGFLLYVIPFLYGFNTSWVYIVGIFIASLLGFILKHLHTVPVRYGARA